MFPSTEYRILRDGQTFGPYSEAELREYFAAGNIVATDLARTPEMTEWKPIRKVLPKLKKASPKKEKKPAKAITLDPAGLRPDLPAPPDIPWWLASILEVGTSFTFFVAWDIVEAIWLRRVQRHSRALLYAGVGGALLLIEVPRLYSGVTHGVVRTLTSQSVLSGLVLTVAFVLRIMTRFSMRNSLLEHYNIREPIGLRLGWWKTLFLGGLYFQFHFNRINELRQRLASEALQSRTPY